VLARVAEGLTNQAIADSEHLAIRSVEKVISSVFQKLDLIDNPTDHRRVLAVLRFLEAGP
jgi:DNA-binding NarL/FixJ family response regulator